MTTAQIIGYTLTYLGLAGFLLMCFRISKPEIEETHLEVDWLGRLQEKTEVL